jgi:alpha-ketoglutarate-dependent dioxygenase alkB family protein 2
MSILYSPEVIMDSKNGLFILVDKSFYEEKDSCKLYDELFANIQFNKQYYIKIHGKTHPIPRQQMAFGDPGTSYTFSGMTVKAKPWIPIISKIKAQIERMLDLEFNFCLVNYYKNGHNYIGYHSDDERDLQKGYPIVSLSFGQERKFYFKSKDPKVKDRIELELNSGCLVVMMNTTNTYWKHSVPKELKVTKPRINLTFRKMTI